MGMRMARSIHGPHSVGQRRSVLSDVGTSHGNGEQKTPQGEAPIVTDLAFGLSQEIAIIAIAYQPVQVQCLSPMSSRGEIDKRDV